MATQRTSPVVVGLAVLAASAALIAVACVAWPALFVLGALADDLGYLPAALVAVAYLGVIAGLVFGWARLARKLRAR